MSSSNRKSRGISSILTKSNDGKNQYIYHP